MKIRYFYFYYFLLIFFSCNTEGHRGSSETIADSRERKVFVTRYEINASTKVVKDSVLSNISEVFLEQAWFVTKPIVVQHNLFNIVIVKKSEDLQKYLIGNQKDVEFTYHSKHSDWMQIGRESLKDSIIFNVYRQSDRSEIGKLSLIRI